MPIKKETSARLAKRNVTHDSISREVVQAITDPVALAIYTYLLTKPENWVVRRGDVIDHFNPLGKDAYARAMRQLTALGVIWMAEVRDDGGRITDRIYVVEQTLEPRKPISRENPTEGKSRHLKKKRLPKEEEIGIRGWQEWVDYRAEIKKKMTQATINKQIKLLSGRTAEEQQAIINQSITNGWTGLFEVKNGNNQGGKQYQGRQTAAGAAQALRDSIARDEAAMASHD